MCLFLRMETVLCFVEKQVRQKEQGQATEKNKSSKPSPDAIRMRGWKS